MREQLTDSQRSLILNLKMDYIEVIYTAGPIRHKDLYGWYRNIERAKIIARTLWAEGFCVICPHANNAFFDGKDIPDEIILKNDLLLVERSDAVVVLPGWETSKGSKGEIEFAEREEIPVYYWPDGVPQEIID